MLGYILQYVKKIWNITRIWKNTSRFPIFYSIHLCAWRKSSHTRTNMLTAPLAYAISFLAHTDSICIQSLITKTEQFGVDTTFYTCIQEVLSFNPGQKITHFYWDLWFSSVPPGKWHDNTSIKPWQPPFQFIIHQSSHHFMV
jgi:hypothetical protein